LADELPTSGCLSSQEYKELVPHLGAPPKIRFGHISVKSS
jgi:hypothetical protein